MKFITTSRLYKIQKSQIRNLWNAEYPAIIQQKELADFEKYLSGLKEKNHILIKEKNGIIVGWFIDFIRDGERWFAMIVSSEIQGKGYGSKLLEMGKKRNTELNGWAVQSTEYKRSDGKPYKPPLGFYEKMGFRIFSEIKFETDIMTTVKIKWEQ